MHIGINLWYDLSTTDVDGAVAFYTESLGWRAQPGPDPNMRYTVFMAGDVGIGGVMELPAEARAQGAPPHWMGYTSVENVDTTVSLVRKLGGTVRRPRFDIPNVGRLAICADPQGATFAVYRPETWSEPADPSAPGHVDWNELNTTDWRAAWAFYRDLFGWQERDRMDMGDQGVYFMFHDATKTTKGGMSNSAPSLKAPPHWLYYVTVSDVKETVERITNNGGRVVNGPMEVPGGDLVAQCCDPQGAMFAVYAPSSS